MILVRNLSKAFGNRRVLNGLDLDVSPGAVTLLVGANGAGKTTSLRIIAGLSSPDDGTIAIAGHDLAVNRREALARLSYLPQAPRFNPRLTVRQTARFHARLRGRTSGIDCALDLWGLGEFAEMPTAKLSGGLRQRLALALITLAETEVIILDEPGISLDPDWRRRLQEFLSAEAARGCTVLVATHLLGEWNGQTDRCVLIENGRARCDLPADRIQECFPLADAAYELSRSSRVVLRSDPVALRGSAGTIPSTHAGLSRSFRSGLQVEKCS